MAIKRCPYCRAIIDERDQYCGNCGTQLLFPEDEFIEEDIPGEKALDVEEKPAGEEAGLDVDLSLDEPGSKPGLEKEPEPELVYEPQPSPQTPLSVTSLGFPPSLTGDREMAKKARKSKKAEDEVVLEPVLESKSPAEEPAAEIIFEDAFFEKEPKAKSEPGPAAEEVIKPRRTEPTSPAKTHREGSLSASTDEIEEIARLMSSLEKKAGEPEAPAPEKTEKKTDIGPTPFFDKEFTSFHDEFAPLPGKEKTGEFSENLLRTVEAPPWMANQPGEPPPLPPLEPLKTQDLPEFGEVDKQTSRPASSADFGDILSKLEEKPAAPTEELDLQIDQAAEEAGPSWADISGSEAAHTDFLADRLGRSRREQPIVRPPRPRQRGGGLKIMARLYDILIIAACWAAAVWLSTMIMSVPIFEIFDMALVQLGLLLLTLAVAYYFLFLYFLGETLGDRLASR